MTFENDSNHPPHGNDPYQYGHALEEEILRIVKVESGGTQGTAADTPATPAETPDLRTASSSSAKPASAKTYRAGTATPAPALSDKAFQTCLSIIENFPPTDEMYPGAVRNIASHLCALDPYLDMGEFRDRGVHRTTSLLASHQLPAPGLERITEEVIANFRVRQTASLGAGVVSVGDACDTLASIISAVPYPVRSALQTVERALQSVSASSQSESSSQPASSSQLDSSSSQSSSSTQPSQLSQASSASQSTSTPRFGDASYIALDQAMRNEGTLSGHQRWPGRSQQSEPEAHASGGEANQRAQDGTMGSAQQGAAHTRISRDVAQSTGSTKRKRDSSRATANLDGGGAAGGSRGRAKASSHKGKKQWRKSSTGNDSDSYVDGPTSPQMGTYPNDVPLGFKKKKKRVHGTAHG